MHLKIYFSNYFKNDQLNFKIIKVEHHLSHISSAFHISGFNNSSVLSVDGFGDFVSTMWGYADKKISYQWKSLFSSLFRNILYRNYTTFRFSFNYGDEYKLMGLSSYGRDTQKDKLYKLFIDMGHQFKLNLKYFNHVDNKFNLDFYDENPIIGNLFNHKIKEILGPARNPWKILLHTIKILQSQPKQFTKNFFLKS